MEPSTAIAEAIVLAMLWIGYFALHSLLASLAAKNWMARTVPGAMIYYRLLFNTLAVLLLFVPVAYLYWHQTEYLWQWQGGMRWLMDGLAVVALALFGWTLVHYDMREFFGLRQMREQVNTVEDQERFKIGTLHRFVRHPWYLLGLVVLWTRSMDLMLLTSAIVISVYLKVGSLLEERKLIAYHGEAYARYRQCVPGIIPRPWRFLSKGQAQRLTSSQY